MSVHRLQRHSGARYRVRWRDERGELRSRTFTKRADASVWDAKVKLAKRQGELEQLDAGKERLTDFLDVWWRNYAEIHLSASTRTYYAGVRARLIEPELGHVPLRRITPKRISEFQVGLRQRGVGDETIRKTLSMLQGALERAVEWGRLTTNPVRTIRKSRSRQRRTVRPAPPATIEEMRLVLLNDDRIRDATLVTLLAYAGLRPGEALALRWSDVGSSTLSIDKALSYGGEKETKTGRARSVRVMQPLRQDLERWRTVSEPRSPDDPVFPRRDGTLWTDVDWRNWRRRRYGTTASGVGLVRSRPYDLRHSLASLLFQERMNPAEIAAQMGHSLAVLLTTYVHVIDELRESPARPAEEIIQEARAAVALHSADPN